MAIRTSETHRPKVSSPYGDSNPAIIDRISTISNFSSIEKNKLGSKG
jgi:hypothetical protein